MWTLLTAVCLPAFAADIYRAESRDGSVSFTDSPSVIAPPGYSAFELFLADDPPPPVSKVNLRTFPLLNTWDGAIVAAADRYGLPASLVKAVALAESGMNPNARSSAGAQGVMQLMPGTAAYLGVADPWDPIESIDGGARYLKQQLEEFGTQRLALAAYNAGPGTVRRAGGVPAIAETQAYVQRVLALVEHFEVVRPIQAPADGDDTGFRAPMEEVLP
jgi:soluble lytic murein transglycosylase-like protein